MIIKFPTFLAHATGEGSWAVSYFDGKGTWKRIYPPGGGLGPKLGRKEAMILAAKKRRFLRSEKQKSKK